MLPTLATTRVAIKNILAATDFTPASEPSLTYSASLARAFDATLHLVNVIEPVVYPLDTPVGIPDTFALARQLAQEKMKVLRDTKVLEGVRHQELLREGLVADVVHDLIDELSIDLVVVGTHGAHGLEKVILGSVAEEIFRSVRCPVLTVGPKARRDGKDVFKRIVFATDFSPQSLRAAQYAISIAEEHDSRITLLHVVNKLGDSSPQTVVNTREDALERLHMLVSQDAAAWCSPEYVVEFGNASERIVQTARDREAGLIVMGVKHAEPMSSHTLWATASKVVQNAPCPVLTVRDHLHD
ncbi:MAG: universal stress protein [Acidobacteriales bacterium]|nr:universal stress protein [Terriglobales bacterium]